MKEITVAATLENLEAVLDFISTELESKACPAKFKTQIAVAVEEIYMNIVHYAYRSETGNATVQCEAGGEPLYAAIRFTDGGVPFNPLDKKDPDVTLPAEERDIGGLGIYLAKRTMDHMEYRYQDGKNILTILKNLT